MGPASAARLADASVRRPTDLRADAEVRAALNPQQRIGAARYDDLRRPIPRVEADAMLALVRDAVGRVSAGAVRVYGCGSYQRGRATSGDVDYLLVPVHARPSGDATGEEEEREEEGDGDAPATPDDLAAVRHMDAVLDELRRRNFLMDDLLLPQPYREQTGPRTYMGVCRLRPGTPHRRIDVKGYPGCQAATALLYFTGDA